MPTEVRKAAFEQIFPPAGRARVGATRPEGGPARAEPVTDPALIEREPVTAPAEGGPPETTKPPFPTRPVAAEDIHGMRSKLRTARRKALQSKNYDLADILGEGVDTLTSVLESQLPPEEVAAMRQNDKAWAVQEIIADAAARAGPEGNFTGPQLHRSVLKSAGKKRTVTGQAGDLQDLAKQYTTVFPKTRQRMKGSVIPGVKDVYGMIGAGMSRPGTREAMLGLRPRLDLPELTVLPQTQQELDSLAMLQALRGQAVGRPQLHMKLAAQENDEEEPR